MTDNIDLTNINKSGISLQHIVDSLNMSPKTKKDIQTSVNTNTSIDSMLKELEYGGLIHRVKVGTKTLYALTVDQIAVDQIAVDQIAVDTIATTKKKVTKAKPNADKTPAQIKNINKQTENIIKEHQILNLVEITDKPKTLSATPHTAEVNDVDLEHLRKELTGRLGKEVTAVLHKRNDRAIKDRKQSAQEIYELTKHEVDNTSEGVDTENTYKFVLNFFTSTLNGEKATPYFRGRDDHVVRIIYNKLKELCDVVDDYAVSLHNVPFYRVITINEVEKVVKIYHIDMNRVVRGIHTVFKLNHINDMFLKFKD